ncbi:ice-binding family protein [Cellulomonas sp. URHB0016]
MGAAEHGHRSVTPLGSLAPARQSSQEPGGARAENDRRPTVLGKDGWLAFVLGTVAQCYLVLLLALTAIGTLPLAFGWDASVVQTGSMRPDIAPGDLVQTSPLPDSEPVPLGAVVQFSAPAAGGGEHQVVHRIVAKGDATGEWVTQGDANIDPDSTALTREKITGQGRLLVRWVGLPSLWWSTGQLGPFLAWLVGTVAATWLTLWTWPGDDSRRTDARGVQVPRARSGLGRARRGSAVPRPGARRAWVRTSAVVGLAALAAGTLALVGPERASAAFTARTTNVNSTFTVASWSNLSLGRASTYAILACTRISNADSHSVVLGNVGVTPGTSVSGFNAVDITGNVDKNTPGAANARTDALAVYDAIGRRPATGSAPATVTGTLLPGTLRRTGPVTLQGTVTLDARGDASSVFVVQADALTFAPGTKVVLANGAATDKVFFVSGSTATVGSAVALRGVLLAQSDVSLDKDTTVAGRVISLQGGVSTKSVSVTQP